MDTCPYCGNKATETTGVFDRNNRFIPSKKQRWYIRTVCTTCKRFLGYRPTDTRKLNGKLNQESRHQNEQPNEVNNG